MLPVCQQLSLNMVSCHGFVGMWVEVATEVLELRMQVIHENKNKTFRHLVASLLHVYNSDLITIWLSN